MDWREFRCCSPAQRLFLDACFGVGVKARTDGRTKLYVLGGGAGFGGKSYSIRTGIFEAAVRLAEAGVNNPLQLVCCLMETDLEERHINKILHSQDTYPHDGEDHSRRGQDIGLLNVGTLKREGKSQAWTFTFTDTTLGKVYFRHAKNLDRRKGAEYDMIWVDELTQFNRDDFDSFNYILRSSKNPPFLSFVGVTNPDGLGNWWVRKLWVPEFQDFSDEKLTKEQFVFVPFRATDNPTFNADVEATLTSASDVMVKSRWYGEWDIISGMRFRFQESVHTFTWRDFVKFYMGKETADASTDSMINDYARELLLDDDLLVHYASFDPGLAHASFHVHAVDKHGNVWTWRELYMNDMIIVEQADAILKEIAGLKIRKMFADPALWGRDQGTGLARVSQFRKKGINFFPAYNDRVSGWSLIDEKLDYKGQPNTEGFLKPKAMIHSGCKMLCHGLRNAPANKNNPDDIDPQFKDDHALDDYRYFIFSHFGKPTNANRKRHDNQTNRIEEGSALASL